MPRKFYLVLITCALMFAILFGASPKPTNSDACVVIVDALKRIDDLTLGDSRSRLEQSFELDGGLQFRTKSRYVFKKCHFIKIDVEFVGEGFGHDEDFLPTDKIVKVSRPYLEYPIYD